LLILSLLILVRFYLMTMTQTQPESTSRVGPFVAGSTSAELTALAASQDVLGLRVLEAEEQKREYFRGRCEALEIAASEFFFPYEKASFLILQKTRDVPALPEFIEYVYCWLAEDRLGGLILSGVTSDAGTHEQINQQEAALWEHAAEVTDALTQKYPRNPEYFLNYFNFETSPTIPHLPAGAPEGTFNAYPRLVTSTVDNETSTRVETHHCGPVLVVPTRKRPDAEISTAATHSSQSSRRFFASDSFFVVYDFKMERYVRTIESIHVFENIVYLAKELVLDPGQRLNSLHCASVQAQAKAEIERWQNSVRQAEDAKTARIQKLSALL
jgi:hypothetical protein